jgi:iron-sulfur cluster repair protein YtfE (RIC family)
MTHHASTDPIREDHVHLLERVERLRATARQLPALTEEQRRALLEDLLSFLEGTLVPHARSEENVLYPEVARLLGDPQATAPMTYDHVAIRDRIGEIAAADASDVPRLQELLYGLHALITTHFWKEEELYLPLLDAGARPEVRQVLEVGAKLDL